MTRATVLFSGGKDSVYATYIAQQQSIDVVGTITMIPSASDSYMFHVPNARLAPVISGAMGLPNLSIEIRDGEDELVALGRGIEEFGADAVITGAIASDYQMFRVNFVCEPLGVKVLSPLWHKSQEALLREIVGVGFDVRMVCAAAEGLDEKWLGRRLDNKAIDELVALSKKRRINIGGEGGEFETIVLDGPNFLRRLEAVSCHGSWKGSAGSLKINAIRSFSKS
jgi:ABC transporter with metal-binding/Fe-S-binding domain ATP-binding protein